MARLNFTIFAELFIAMSFWWMQISGEIMNVLLFVTSPEYVSFSKRASV